MKNIILPLIIVFAVAAAEEAPTLPIIPSPQRAETNTAIFKITSSTKIILGTGNSTEEFIAQQLNDELASRDESQLKVIDLKSLRKLPSNYIYLGSADLQRSKKFLKERKGTLTKEMKEEGYFLSVDKEGIVIIAESNKGLFYGMMSLLQLLEQEKRSTAVKGVTIHDFPSQKIRGITDDISRGQISTVENFKKIIRFCARNKMNVYCPYIEDVFAFKQYPEIGKGRGALTAAECRELDAYGKKYFVDLIPIFETLGHWENILILPKYVKYGEFPGAQTVNISDEKVYAMLDDMIGEISSCFSSPYFHIAADESWDVGLGVNKERVAKSDLATVHAEHYKRVAAIVRKYGKKPIMYGDIILNHPDILKKIPQDITIVDWHYGASLSFSSPQIFQKAGFPYIVSPAVWNFTGPFPNFINTFLNIKYLNLDGFNHGSQGILCSNWNDFGGEALRELNYYGYAWNAECAWNPQQAEQTAFDKKFFAGFFDTHEPQTMHALYAILSDPANQYHWYELWRHPMLPNRDDMIWEKRLPLLQRMQSIQSTMPLVLSLLQQADKEVQKNADQLQELEFAAKLNLWFAQKIETQEKIKLMLKDSTRNLAESSQEIVTLCRQVVENLEKIKSEFEKIWLTANRRPSLDLLLQRYDRQAQYWNELAAQIQQGNFAVDPQLQSQWIYHPNANPNARDTSAAQVPTAYFRKEFSVKKNLRSAKIQLLGDTWSQLYVNGKFVGEVMARRSLSLMVENQRAKIFDILPLLTDSTNCIAVQSQNFQPMSSAGINIYAEFVAADGKTDTLMSDETWKVSDKQFLNWNQSSFSDVSWNRAAAKKYPTPVVKPNLATDRTSWYER